MRLNPNSEAYVCCRAICRRSNWSSNCKRIYFVWLFLCRWVRVLGCVASLYCCCCSARGWLMRPLRVAPVWRCRRGDGTYRGWRRRALRRGCEASRWWGCILSVGVTTLRWRITWTRSTSGWSRSGLPSRSSPSFLIPVVPIYGFRRPSATFRFASPPSQSPVSVNPCS